MDELTGYRLACSTVWAILDDAMKSREDPATTIDRLRRVIPRGEATIEARALAAELVQAAEQVEAATLTGAVVDPGDCKPGEFYVAIGAEGWIGPVPFILSLAHAKHCRPGEVVRPCIWGFSAYRRTPGYRTLGVDFAEWMSLPGQDNVIIRRDYDRVAAHKKKRGHAPKVTT